MVDLKIENVIAATDLEGELDLAHIAETLKDAEYDPDRFPGLIYKLKSPKTLTLMFSKGYTVCTGAKSIQNAKAAITIIYKKLNDQKLIALEKVPKINIQNIIVSYKYKTPLDLEELSIKLPGDNVEYDTKKFPGLIFQDQNSSITVLIFKSGVIVAYGSSNIFKLEELLVSLEKHYS
jgi:transcription initiation factor TFIID TATA-box-binding protein